MLGTISVSQRRLIIVNVCSSGILGVLDTMDTINSITTRLKKAAFHSLNRARTIICCDIQKLVYLGRIVNM